MYKIIRTIAVCGLALIIIGCEKKPPPFLPTVPVIIGAASSALALPIFVAEEEGFFQDEGINPQVVNCISGRKCMDMLLAGTVNIATVGDVPIMFDAFQHGSKFLVVGTISTSSTDIKLITTSTTITAVKELEQKRIGITPRTTNQYFLDTYLLLNGIDPKNVTMVPLQPTEMLEALESKKVDVVSIWEPIAHQIALNLEKNNVQVKGIISSEAYTATFNLVIPRSSRDVKDAETEAVLRAVHRAEELIRTNPIRAKAIFAQRLNLAPRVVNQIWPAFTYRLSLNTEMVTTLENQARWALREGYITAEQIPSYIDLMYPGPLQAVIAQK